MMTAWSIVNGRDLFDRGQFERMAEVLRGIKGGLSSASTITRRYAGYSTASQSTRSR
jgi:hypothetical protein